MWKSRAMISKGRAELCGNFKQDNKINSTTYPGHATGNLCIAEPDTNVQPFLYIDIPEIEDIKYSSWGPISSDMKRAPGLRENVSQNVKKKLFKSNKRENKAYTLRVVKLEIVAILVVVVIVAVVCKCDWDLTQALSDKEYFIYVM